MFKFNRPKFGKIRWKIKKKNEKEIPTGSYRRKFEVRELAICSRRWPFFYLFFFGGFPWRPPTASILVDELLVDVATVTPPPFFPQINRKSFVPFLSVSLCVSVGPSGQSEGGRGGGVPVRFLMKKGCVKPSNTNENPFEPSQT